MTKQQDLHITEAELEILQILWEKKNATVKEVHEILNRKREAVYTTTLKQMQVMLEKKLLSRNDDQRQHIYSPAVQKEKVQKKFMDKLMDTFFKGNASNLVIQTLNNYSTSTEELELIKKMIDNAKKAKK
ncbi:MAG: BlaI/MecI/CopY family transcriptional regulator [Flavipsychrobacter sp.]